MSNREIIRNFYGKVIGYIDTDEQGNKTVRNFYGKILGFYQKSDNTTRDFYKRIIARGDQSSGLIWREQK